MSWVLVCGSIALDFVGHYRGSFATYQQRYDVKALNISLQLAEMRTSFGGCGMNIVYGLHRLDVETIPLSAAGANFMDHYHQHLTELGINTQYIAVDDSLPQCATAMVISDDHGNQITGFHSGASVSELRKLPREIERIDDCRIALLAPEDAPIMLRQARDLHGLGIPVIFDPGQGIAEFTQGEIRELLALSHTVMVNVHEYDILQHNSALAGNEVEERVQRVVVTKSAGGVDVYEDGDVLHVDAVADVDVVDATGCGDAFRAGYLYGVMRDLDTRQCLRMGCLVAAVNLGTRDTQTYDIDEATLRARYESIYGEVLPGG